MPIDNPDDKGIFPVPFGMTTNLLGGGIPNALSRPAGVNPTYSTTDYHKPANLEDAAAQLQRRYGWDYEQATRHIAQMVVAGDPKYTTIPYVHESLSLLNYEHGGLQTPLVDPVALATGVGEIGLAGGGLTALAGGAVRNIAGQVTANKMQEAVTQRTGSGGLGMAAGILMDILQGEAIKRLPRGGSFSDIINTAKRSSAGVVDEPPAAKVSQPAQAPAQPTTFQDIIQGNKTAQAGAEAVRGPQQPATPQTMGVPFEIPPTESNRPGFLMTADEKLQMGSRAPVGTMLLREGEPFQADFMRRELGPGNSKIFYDYRNPAAADLGAWRFHIDNPKVFEVESTGEEALREAVREAYQDTPGVLDAIDNTANPKKLALELLGRWAKEHGHDAVVIKSPVPEEHMIIDYSKFKPTVSADMPEDMFKKGTRTIAKPPPIAGGKAGTAKLLEDLDRQLEAELARIKEKPDDADFTATNAIIAKMNKIKAEGQAKGVIDNTQQLVEDLFGKKKVVSDQERLSTDKGSTTVRAAQANDKAEAPAFDRVPTAREIAHKEFHEYPPTPETNDAGEIESEVSAEERILHTQNLLAVESPKAIDPDIAANLDASGPIRRKPLASLRFPSDVSDHPAWRRYMADIFDNHRKVYGQVQRSLANVLRRITKGMSDEDYDEMARAVEGLKRDPQDDFKLKQTEPDIRPEINQKALAFRQQITDKLYTFITGNDPKTFSILDDFNLKHDRRQLERLRLIQHGKMPGNTTTSEVMAANLLKGMLGFDSSHDLNWEPVEGYLMHDPIDNERAHWEDIIKRDQEYKKMGIVNQDSEAMEDAAKNAVARLKEIDKEMAAARVSRLPLRDTLPKRQYAGPINTARDPLAAEMKYKTDIKSVGSDYIRTALNKRFNDWLLSRTRQLMSDYKGAMTEPMKDYVTTFVNGKRGARGFRGDALIADTYNGFKRAALKLAGREVKYEATASDIHKAVSTIMNWQYYAKLGLTPIRFPLINLTHSLTTTMSDVGPSAYAKAFFRVMFDPTGAAFKRAIADGVIDNESQWLKEVGTKEGTVPGPVRRVLGATSFFAEKARFVIDYEAALEQYRRGEISPIAVLFVKDKAGRNEIQAMREYARAHVIATQFPLGIENKPTGFSANSATRLLSQFKTWSVGLTTFSKNLVKTGDPKKIIRLAAALTMFGGLKWTLGGPTLYDAVRRGLLREGVTDLPDKTGIQYIADQLGLDRSLGELNIFSLTDPYNIIPPLGMPQQFISWAAGPTLGGGIDLAINAYNDWMRKGQAFVPTILGDTLTEASPQLKAALDAAGMLAEGGMTGPNGAIQANKSWAATIMRGLDITSSATSQRHNYQEDIAAAMIGGRRDLALTIIEEARNHGIVLDDKFTQGVMSIYNRYRREERKPSWDVIMGR